MQAVTVRIPEETYRTLEAEADEEDRSMSEVVREQIEKGMDYEEVKRDRDRLRDQMRTLIEDREERTELVEYVERQRDLEREEREKRNAPAWRRAKYWLFGYNPGLDE